jgi:hypothetical protein
MKKILKSVCILSLSSLCYQAFGTESPQELLNRLVQNPEFCAKNRLTRSQAMSRLLTSKACGKISTDLTLTLARGGILFNDFQPYGSKVFYPIYRKSDGTGSLIKLPKNPIYIQGTLSCNPFKELKYGDFCLSGPIG